MRLLMELTLIGSIFTLILLIFKTPLIKRFGGSWYYYIWTAVLFSFCFPYKADISKFITNMIMADRQTFVSVTADTFVRQNVYKGASAAAGAYGASQRSLVAADSIAECVFILYFIGLAGALMYYTGMYISFRQKLKKSLLEPREGYRSCLNEVCSEMGIVKNIQLMESSEVRSPIFTGLLHPMIVIPNQDFNKNDLRLILRHELTHYKRGDMIYKTTALAVHILHWFNPFSYFAMRTINEACEYSCDEYVTKYMDDGERKQYGYMLLNQLKTPSEKPLFAAMFCKNGKNILKRRFEIIMSDKKYRYVKITTAFICALVLVSGFFDLKPINVLADGNTAEYEADSIESVSGVNGAETTEKLEPAVKISEEKAVEMAEGAISKYYDIDPASLTADASYYEEGSDSVQPEGWFIRLFPDDPDKQCDYAAWIAPDGSRVTVAVSGLFDNSLIIGEDSISEIESDNGWISRLSEISGESESDIKNVQFPDIESSTGSNMVDVSYELDDGKIYTATLTYPDKELKGITISAG